MKEDLKEDLIQSLKTSYPRRDGGQGWNAVPRLVATAIGNGATLERMKAGSDNYAKHCQRKGIAGTEFVMQARTFFGRDQHFEEWADMDMRTPNEIAVEGRWHDLELRAQAVNLLSLDRSRGLDVAAAAVLTAEREALNKQWEARGMNGPKFLKVVG